MALPDYSMRQLLQAGVHIGRQAHRTNPKMERYIFGVRSNTHIIDLSQTVPLLHQALLKVRETAAKGGRILFVGTKRQASEFIASSAKRSAQYYVNHRWLGGMLTNWQTTSKSIQRLRELTDILAQGSTGLAKKDVLNMMRERDRLDRVLGGIASMGGLPDLLFVIDTNKEAIALQESRKLGIPIVAIVDTNCDPDEVNFPIPGNDGAPRAIQMYCHLIADAVLDGLSVGQAAAGVDLEAIGGTTARQRIDAAPKGSPLATDEGVSPDARLVASLAKAGVGLNSGSAAGRYHFFRAVRGRIEFECCYDSNEGQLKGYRPLFRWEVPGSAVDVCAQILSCSLNRSEIDACAVDIMLPDRIVTYADLGSALSNGSFKSTCDNLVSSLSPRGGCALKVYPSEGHVPFDLLVAQPERTSRTLVSVRANTPKVASVADIVAEMFRPIGASSFERSDEAVPRRENERTSAELRERWLEEGS